MPLIAEFFKRIEFDVVIVYEDGDENEVELEEYDTINGEDHKGDNYDF